MATATNKKLQDMPPEGGYEKISFKRIPPKSYMKGWGLLGTYLGVTAGAAYVFFLTKKKLQYEHIENKSGEFAIYPMLMAERDREYLKQLRRNRDEEARLMANVEGWEVGTWYGEKIYKTTDKLVEPNMADFYVHSHSREHSRRAHIQKTS